MSEPLTLEELERARAALELRLEEYRALGHDRLCAARFVVDLAGRLRSPVLDVGTGRGLLALELARRGLEVESVDPDAKDQALAAHLAEREGLAVRLHCRDAAALPFDDGHFGATLMMNVLHHLDEAEPVLCEMTRVVAADGAIVLAEFDAAGFEVVARAHRANGGEHPVGPVTFELALETLARLGWRPVRSAAGELHRVSVLGRRHQ